MNELEHHMPEFSAADIEKYLNGELSAAEMHALEKAALEDPFLADAIDGIAFHQSLPGSNSLQNELSGLRHQLDSQTKSAAAAPAKRRILPLYLRYAAVFLLVAAMGTTTWYVLRDRPAPRLSQANSKVLDSTRSTPPAPAVSAPSRDTITAPAIQNPPPPSAAAIKENAVPPAPVFIHPRRMTAPNRHDNPVAHHPDLEFEQSRLKKTDTASLHKNLMAARSSHPPTDAFRRQLMDSPTAGLQTIVPAPGTRPLPGHTPGFPPGLVYKGQVTDLNNNPLPGASLLVKGNKNLNAVTDKNGYFSLTVPTTQNNTQVLVNYVGFATNEVELNTDNAKGNIIQLQPQQNALDEVVVTGYGTKRKEMVHPGFAVESKPLSLVAVPASGWPAYNNYLEAGKKLSIVDSTLKGNESITFNVGRNGHLSSFHVEQSLSPAHDSASIRLIREGPPWKVLNNRKSKARVVIAW